MYPVKTPELYAVFVGRFDYRSAAKYISAPVWVMYKVTMTLVAMYGNCCFILLSDETVTCVKIILESNSENSL